MQKHLLQISKPHFIDRFQQPTPIIIKTKRDHSKIPNQTVKKKVQTAIPEKNKQKKEYILERVRKFKQELLWMLIKSKQNWQMILLNKQKSVSLMKEDHRIRLQQIFEYIGKIKIKTFLSLKHQCKNRKQKHCRLCFQTENSFKLEVINYLKQSKKREAIRQYRRNGILKSKRQGKRFLNENEDQNNNEQSNAILGYHTSAGNHFLKNRLNEDRLNFTYQDDINSKGSTKFRFHRSKQGGFMNKNNNYNNNQGSQSNQESGSLQKKKRIKKLHKNGSSNYTEENSQDEVSSVLIKTLSDSDLQQNSQSPDQSAANRQARRSYRKSIIKLAGKQIEELTTTNKGKSKFYLMASDEKSQVTDQINYLKQSSLLSTLRGGKSQKKKTMMMQYQQQEQELKFNKKKTNTSKKGKFQTHTTEHIQQQFFPIEIPSQVIQEIKPQSIKEIQEIIFSKPIEPELKKPKFSRYQRERMFYGFLKQELVKVGCLQDLRGNHETYLTGDSQMSIESMENIESIENKQEQNYSLKQRKQSLIKKLNFFNQTSNFQDIKNKIGAVLDKKNNIINENLKKQCQLLEKSGVNEQTKQRIIQKFLSEVLKISDLKRLLRKKFSKQMTWSPKMREMHQFYTYLQYSLEIFRTHLEKNQTNNCIQLSIEGKQAQINLENFNIEQDIGQYEGLEGSQFAEFEHHKQIECSMKYYGIQVKRLEKLNQFHYQDFDQNEIQPSLISQKSLKEIQECTCSIPKNRDL